MSSDNKDKKRDIAPSQADTSPIEVMTTTTTIGDKDKKILDTGDISRASIAKGIRSPDDGGVTAADIVKGTTKPEDVISHTTGISADNGKVLNPKTEASITKELDRDISTMNNTEDVSKLVSSGTSSSKSGGIDKDDIYSSDEDGTRHLEKVQETKTTTDDEKAT
jgi:predicted phage gp36 major capsid-like protein